MDLFVLLIAFAHIAVFASRGGVPLMVAPSALCYVAPRRFIFPLLALGLVAGAMLLEGDMGLSFAVDKRAIFVSFTAAFTAYVACKAISVYISRLYLFVMALVGYNLLLYDDFDFGWHHYAGWVISPVAAFLLAVIIYNLLVALLRDTNALYLNFLQAMGYLLSLATLLLFVAVGINLGGLMEVSALSPWCFVVLGAAVVLAGYRKRLYISVLSEHEFDINPLVALATLLSTIAVILFFSFDVTASLIGVEPTVISPVFLLFASLLGSSRSQHRNVMSGDDILRISIANAVAMAMSLILGYLLAALLAGGFMGDIDLRGVMLGLALVVVVVLVLVALRYSRKSYQRAQLAREQAELLEANRRSLNRLEVEAMLAENENLRNKLELKHKEVMSIAMNITEQKDFMQHLYEELKTIRSEEDAHKRDKLLDELHTELLLRMNFSTEIDSFYVQAEHLHKDFTLRLAEQFPALTPQERRLAILLRLEFSTKYIATLMNITPKSVEISRHRLRAKLGLKREQNLTNFIKTI